MSLLIQAVKKCYDQHKGYKGLKTTQKVSEEDQQDWGFYITESNVGLIISRDNDKLYFNKDHFIQANQSIKHEYINAYFEIELLSFKSNKQLLFGLATDMKKSNFKDNSILLNTTTQKIEFDGVQLDWTLLPTIEEGDTIGCLYTTYPDHEVMFTLNGKEIITLRFGDKKLKIFPTIFASESCFISYNFGKLPFIYQDANSDQLGLVTSDVNSYLPPTYSVA